MYEGEIRYLIEEASRLTGVEDKEISLLIKMGKIEAEKLPSGEWVVTKPGLIALKRMATKIPKTDQTVHFRTPEQKEVFLKVQKLAKKTGMPIRTLTVTLIKHGLEDPSFQKDIGELGNIVKRLGL